MGQLDGQAALITGGGRGQGRSHAIALAREGADIVVCDIAEDNPTISYPMATANDLDETVRLVEKEGRRAIGVVADMRKTDQVQRVIDAMLSKFGRIDILVANHGVISYNTVEAMSDEEWQSVIDTNLTAVFKTMRAVIPTMKAQSYGRIIATSSGAGRAGYPNLPHYVASKWGVIGLVKGCAKELEHTGITVNAICPNSVETDLYFNDATYKLFCPDIQHPTADDFRRRLAEHRHGLNGRPYLQVEHVSRAVVYHATEPDGVLTGQVTDIGLGASAMNTA